MGYCTYGGKLVPGNNQASCIGGGGDWVSGQTLPGSQLGSPAMNGAQAFETNRPPIRPEPDRGIPGYRAPQYTDSPKNLNTDDFGQVLPANFEGDTGFETLRDRAVNKNNTSIFNKPSNGPIERTTTADPRLIQTENGLRAMTEDEMSKEDLYNVGQQFNGVFGSDDESNARGASSAKPRSPGDHLFLSANPYTGKPGAVEGKRVVNNSGKTSSIGPMLQPNIGPRSEDGVFGQSSANKLGGGVANKPNIFDRDYTGDAVKGSEGSKLSGIWDNISKPGFWSDKVEGGSGSWDNRLYRLGEMLDYMGKEPSQRTEDFSKRWADAEKESNIVKAAGVKTSKTAAAASAKVDKAKIDNLMKVASTSPKDLSNSVKEYLPKELDNSGWWSSMSDSEKSSMSMSIAVRASQAMKLAATDSKFMPYSVAMKMAAQQIVDENTK